VEFLKKEFPEASDDQIDSLYRVTADDAGTQFDFESDEFDDLLYGDAGEKWWMAQNLRGKMAVDQDFDAVAMYDENGTSYFIPYGSKAKNIGTNFDWDSYNSAISPQAPSPLEGTLDMSQAARMQRANEGRYLPETYYHATSSDFEEFVPKYNDKLTFITPNVNFANNWLGKGGSRSKLGSARYDDPITVEYNAEKTKVWDKYSSRYGNDIDLWPEIEQQNYRKERNTILNLFDSIDQSIYPLRTNVENTFDPRQHEDVIAEYLRSKGRDPFATTIERGITDLDYYKLGNYLQYENPEMVELLKSKGFDSMRLAESTYNRSIAPVFDTLAIFDPSNIRSVNAAFDPAKRGSPNIMAGAAGATIGLSALRNIQRDEEPQPD
jgi:hypothetical protein